MLKFSFLLVADTELVSLHQNRVIGDTGQYPVYVELRSRESPSNDTRQSCLSFVYANIYGLRRMTNGEWQLTVDSVNLDSIKGFTHSINFIGIRNTSHILMSWTEQTMTRTRCGICKYNIKLPDYDSVESILDFAYLQHSIKSMCQMTGKGMHADPNSLQSIMNNLTMFVVVVADNSNQVIGCGDRIVSVWDHRNGDLLMNFEIDLPSIGTNLGCLCINYDVSVEYPIHINVFYIIFNHTECRVHAVDTTL